MLMTGTSINQEKLQELVSQLPARHQAVVRLMLEGETDQEIAGALDLKTQEVRRIQKEAVWFCKGICSNFGLEEEDFKAL